MTLGEITLIDNTSGKYFFIDKNGKSREELFKIFNLQEQNPIEKECFTKFGGAQSPYKNGEKSGLLRITDSLSQLNNIKGYVESIILHELSDYDDNINSMLKSEIFVIEKIQNSSELNPEEKAKVIEYHVGFFQSAKEYFERIFSVHKKYFENHKDQKEAMVIHYKKICGVVEYLEGIK